MKENTIRVSTFDFIDFLHIDIKKAIGEHTIAKIVGTISNENGDYYVENHKPGDGVCITAITENGNSQTLLNGIVQSISIYEVNELKTLAVTVVSRSFQMDIQKHVRTFQDSKMTYDDVIDRIHNSGDIGNILIPAHSGTAIGSMLVQYEETDWQFCKRLASRLNTYVVADNVLDVPYIAIGIPKKKASFEMYPVEYCIRKDNAEYLDNVMHEVPNYSMRDSIYYEVVSREIHDLCEPAVFKGHRVIVYAVSTRLVGAVLQHTYTLKEREGFRCKEYFNREIIGASLNGNVVDIKTDKVRVEIRDDVPQNESKWFSYATVYSSPDNTGWYFMPEMGDEIRLHFPNEHEAYSYVIGSAHVGGRDGPDTKSIRTKWGKAVVFSPNSILITNGAGSDITLDDDEGIALMSSKKISITADDSVGISSQGKISIIGDKGVVMTQSGNIISIKENIDLSAGNVRIR